MILDSQLQFSSAQAITAPAASTNAIDVSEARNIGLGKDLYVVVTVDTSFTDGGSNTGTDVFLYGDSTSTFTPDGKQLLFTLPKNAAAGSGPYVAKISPSLVAGIGAGNFEFLEVYYSPTGANLTAGAVTATISADIAAYQSYPKNYTIA